MKRCERKGLKDFTHESVCPITGLVVSSHVTTNPGSGNDIINRFSYYPDIPEIKPFESVNECQPNIRYSLVDDRLFITIS